MSSLTSYSAIKHPLNARRLWWVVDATGWHVGRLATQIATVLQGSVLFVCLFVFLKRMRTLHDTRNADDPRKTHARKNKQKKILGSVRSSHPPTPLLFSSLVGKHKPFYNPAIEGCGDHVIVLNADKVEFSGNKWSNKVYRYHTGWKGGLKEVPVKRWRERNPERILEHAVHGMLPKNRSRRVREERLICINGDVHPHGSQILQNPWKMALNHPLQSKTTQLPRVPGFYVNFRDEEEKLVLEMTEYVPEKDTLRAAERERKRAMQKALKQYLVGKGPRPDFLPQPESAAKSTQ